MTKGPKTTMSDFEAEEMRKHLDLVDIRPVGVRIATLSTKKPLTPIEQHRLMLQIADSVLPPMRPYQHVFRFKPENEDD